MCQQLSHGIIRPILPAGFNMHNGAETVPISHRSLKVRKGNIQHSRLE